MTALHAKSSQEQWHTVRATRPNIAERAVAPAVWRNHKAPCAPST